MPNIHDYAAKLRVKYRQTNKCIVQRSEYLDFNGSGNFEDVMTDLCANHGR